MNEAEHSPKQLNPLFTRGRLPQPLPEERPWLETKQEPANDFVQSLLRQRAETRRTRAASPDHVLLVVEDEADDFVLLDRALRRSGGGAAVRWAQSATEALAILERLEAHAQTICVVADLQLPDLDGFELLQRIKERSSHARLRFAFLTGRPDPTTETRAQACGADAFFVKPANAEDLMTIAAALHDLAL